MGDSPPRICCRSTLGGTNDRTTPSGPPTHRLPVLNHPFSLSLGQLTPGLEPPASIHPPTRQQGISCSSYHSRSCRTPLRDVAALLPDCPLASVASSQGSPRAGLTRQAWSPLLQLSHPDHDKPLEMSGCTVGRPAQPEGAVLVRNPHAYARRQVRVGARCDPRFAEGSRTGYNLRPGCAA
jgi:hypothetical protein